MEVYWDQDKEVTMRIPDHVDQNNRQIFTIEKRKGGWHSKRIRQDKRLPNDQFVYAAVLRTQLQFLSIDKLRDAIEGKSTVPGVPATENPFERKRVGAMQGQTTEQYEDDFV